jgi:hypothetical protein
MAAKRPSEYINVFMGKPLTNGGRTEFSKELNFGNGIEFIDLILNLAVTIGNGSGAIAQGELQFVKNVEFYTDNGEVHCGPATGRELYEADLKKSETAPSIDAIAAASATYQVPLRIWKSDPLMSDDEMHASILDMDRYGSVTLALTIGTVADLFTTPGTSSVVATLDCYVQRRTEGLAPEERPSVYSVFRSLPPVNPQTTPYIDLDRAANLRIKRVHIHTTDGAGSSPTSGVAADDVLESVNIETLRGFIMRAVQWTAGKWKNKRAYKMESLRTGVVTLDFCEGSKSLVAAFKTWLAMPLLRLNLVESAGIDAAPQVTVCYEGVKPLTPVSRKA